MLKQRSHQPFLESATGTILWAVRNGFTTISMDSPLLWKASRRSEIAAELQRRCGDVVLVTPIYELRRLNWIADQAFMLPRRKLVNRILKH